jgi:hypothetical protein
MDNVGARISLLTQRLRARAGRDELGLNESSLLVHRTLARMLERDPDLRSPQAERAMDYRDWAPRDHDDRVRDALR